MMDSENIVQEGDSCILRLNNSTIQVLSNINKSQDQRIGKYRLSVKPLIGATYGSVFEISNRKQLVKLDGADLMENSDNIIPDFEDELDLSTSQAGNNSNYVDSNTAQKLSMSEVINLRVR